MNKKFNMLKEIAVLLNSMKTYYVEFEMWQNCVTYMHRLGFLWHNFSKSTIFLFINGCIYSYLCTLASNVFNFFYIYAFASDKTETTLIIISHTDLKFCTRPIAGFLLQNIVSKTDYKEFNILLFSFENMPKNGLHEFITHNRSWVKVHLSILLLHSNLN